MNSRVLVTGSISIVVFGALLINSPEREEKAVQGVQSQILTNDGKGITTLNSQLKSMGAVEVEVTPLYCSARFKYGI